MKATIYGAVSAVIALLFSIILWFQWLGTQNFTIASGIQTAIIWAIGVVILVLAAGLIGYLSSWFKVALGMGDTYDIFDMLGIIVIFLFSIILWFTWLSNPANFTITGVITTAILWIVVALIITLVALVLDFVRTKFFDYLPTPTAPVKKA